MITRRSLGALAVGAGLPLPALAQGLSNRPIRLVIPFTPAGTTDLVGRLTAERLSARLGQQVVVDNRPGASGNVGGEFVARAEPDGHTLLLTTIGTGAINFAVFGNRMPFKPEDLAAVGLMCRVPNVLMAANRMPIRTLADMVREAKAKPGALNYGIGNAGGLGGTHLLSQAAGFKAEQISYRGTPQAMADLLGGRLHFLVTDLGPAVEHLRAGTIRALAVTTARRVETLPDVPTVAEAALPGFDFASWNGSWMPARTPPAIIARLNREMVTIGQSDEAKRHIGALGIVSTTSTPEALGEFNRRELELWARIAAEANVAKE